MSNPGQAVLSVAGAFVGFWIGGPTGAAWGFQLGGLAGSAIFPTDLGTVSGPRLNDLNVQVSTVGAPIPIVYGTYAISGNVIWSSGIIETVSRKKQGGKGGPTQTVKTYTYKVNCAVGLCEGEITSIIRIWADAKLIYDVRGQQDGETDLEYSERVAANDALAAGMEIYVGAEDQLADPTIESFEGVGNISAFRGLAYVVFSDFQLADYGNRIPNFRFEVASAGSRSCETVTEGEPRYLFPWRVSGIGPVYDPRSAQGIDAGIYEYGTVHYSWPTFQTQGNNPAHWTSDIAEAVAIKEARLGRTLEYFKGYSMRVPSHEVGYSTPASSYDDSYYRSFDKEPCAHTLNPQRYIHTHAYINTFPTLTECVDISRVDPDLYETERHIAEGAGHYQTVDYAAANQIGGAAAFVVVSSVPGDWKILGLADDTLMIRRRFSEPPLACAFYPAAPGNPDFCIRGGKYIRQTTPWESYSDLAPFGPLGDPWMLSSWDIVFGDLTYGIPSVINRFGVGPMIHPDDPRAGDEAFWTGAYNDAVWAGRMDPGLVYGVDYPMQGLLNTDNLAYGLVTYYYASFEICTAVPGPVPLWQIVRDVCLRCGLTDEQIDVTDLTEMVDGYAVTRVMTGRAAIDPLRNYGFFDCVESDGALKWPTRGKAAVLTITEADLCAFEPSGTRPSSMEVARQQTLELPRRLRVHYAQTAQNYEPGEQSASRLSAGAQEVRDLEIAVAMSDRKAAQIADVVLYDVWTSRNTHRLIVDQSFLPLEPADPFEAPVDGRVERLRALTVDYSLPGLIAIEAARDDDGAYVSYAVSAPAASSGTGGATISTPGEPVLVLLDLPALRDDDNEAGYYAAVRSIGGTTFGGAVVYRSPDGGVTYDDVAAVDFEATVGELTEALPTGPTTVEDIGNELLVELSSGDLESIGEASLMAGLNAAAIGADDRWEIIQFRTVEGPDTSGVYTLTGLLRGRRGTEWAVGLSQVGDAFVLLDAALARVPMNISALGTSRQHKAVLAGLSIDSIVAQSFAGEGAALMPFSPVQVVGEWSGGDVLISWTRRDRFGQEMQSGRDMPMSETSEAYEIDILDGNSPPAVLRTLTSATPSVTYTAAQIADDFGSPVPETVDVRVYQLSATVGRGYPAEATV